MAKKRIEAAEIIITTTDGGSMKVTGKEAQKLAKQMEGLGGASQGTDRRIKGVTQQSSNASKNFSKQAQTMQGGIVAVYAQIAANVFAVSAAYQFLKSSMETKNLIEGQKAFGSITGVAYKTLTNDLQKATEGMLDFKAAASATAIGVASGLSANSLTQLGEAAKNASLALGRDLTDSFNRLIRGVTKAEPELLDELGIVLRLENATRNYAQSVGKAREDLTAYERTQAVLNDVLEQAERKFGRITELMDPDAFALGQLTKEIDDLVLGFQRILIEVLLPFIQFFKDNAAALVAAIGLFVAPIISSMLPDLEKAADRASKASSKAWGDAADNMRAGQQELKTAFAGMKTLGKEDELEAAGGLKKLGVEGKGPSIKDAKGADSGLNTLSKRQIAAYRRAIKEKKGLYMKMTKEEQVIFKKHLATSEAMFRKSKQVEISIAKRTGMIKDSIVKAGVATFAAAEAAKLQIAKAGAIAMNAVMSIAGVLGVIAMVLAAGKALWDWFAKGDKAAQKMKKETEEIHERMKGINEELSRMAKVRSSALLGLADGIAQQGNALQSVDMKKLMSDYDKELKKSGKTAEQFAKTDIGQSFLETARNVERLNPGMQGLAQNMQEGVTVDQSSAWVNLATDIISAAQALAMYADNTKAVNKSIEATINKQAKLPFEGLMKPLRAATDNYEEAEQMIKARRDEMQRQWEQGTGGFEVKDMISYHMTPSHSMHGGGSMQKVIDTSAVSSNVATLKNTLQAEGSGYDFKGGVMTEQSLRKFVEDAGLTTDTWAIGDEIDLSKGGTDAVLGELLLMSENAEKIKDLFTLTDQEAADLAKAMEEAAFEAKRMEDENARNLTLLTKMETVQKDILALEKAKTDAKIALAGKGVGSGKELAFAKAKMKVTQQEHKEEKARIDVTESEANRDLQRRKLIDEMLQDETFAKEHNLNLEKLLAMETADILALGKDEFKTQKNIVDNAEKGVENSKAEYTLQQLLTTNAGEQLTLDQAKLKIQYMRLANLQREMELTNRIASHERGKKTSRAFGFAKAKEGKSNAMTDAKFKKEGIGNKLTDNLASIQAYDDTFTEGTDLATYANDLDVDSDAYKELNKLIAERNGLFNDRKDTEAEITRLNQEAAQFMDDKMGAALEETQFKREQAWSLNPAQKVFNDMELAHMKEFGDLEDFNADKAARMAQEQANLNIELELMNGIQSTLTNGFVSMFQSMVDGSKSFGEAMKDLAKNVLADLAAMMAKAAAMKMLMAMGGPFASLAGGRYGGVMSGPGKKSFGYGGVASGPQSGYTAMLHGTEAVVPLGNDRSIPVDLNGAGGGGNVVNVSISMNGNGQSQSSVTGDGMQSMGRAIGGLVQQHLQQEMRPGGLLNPQGTKGRG